MSKHDNWSTPPDLFKVVNDEFGFDLDAAASDDNHLCPRYITQSQDALVTPWDGKNVWCNPPYSRLPDFVARAYGQCHLAHSTIVMLLPAYTDTRYWAEHCSQAHEIRFLKGRLRFWEGDRVGKDTARFSSALVIFKWLAGQSFGKSPNTFVWDWRS
jgi:phage N-6-adenine-methyltransferase